jgi:adenylate cyclase
MRVYFPLMTALLFLLFAERLAAKGTLQSKLDSLAKAVENAKPDTNKVNLLNQLAFKSSTADAKQSLKYAEEAYALASKLNWTKGMAWAIAYKGSGYRDLAEYDKAKQCMREGLRLFESINETLGVAAFTCNLGSVLQEEDLLDSALYYMQLALKLDEKHGYKKYAAIVTNNIADIYHMKKDHEQAIKYQEISIALNTELGDEDGLAANYNSMGVIYDNLGDYPRALANYLKMLKIAEKKGDNWAMAVAHVNVGSLYFTHHDYTNALLQYEKALQFMEKAGRKKNGAIILSNIGSVYCDGLGEYEKSLHYFLQAMEIHEEVGNKFGKGLALGNIGIALKQMKQYEAAATCYNASMMITKEIGDETGTATNLKDLAGICLAIIKDPKGQPIPLSRGLEDSLKRMLMKYNTTYKLPTGKSELLKAAINYQEAGLKIAKETEEPLLMRQCYEGLATSYRMNGNFKAALEAADNYRAIKDSAFSTETEKKILQQSLKFDFEKKEAVAKVEQEKKDELTAKELQRQKMMRNGFLGGFAVMVLFAGVFLKQRNHIKEGKKQSDELLLNILPAEVAEELKAKGRAEAKLIEEVTVLFTDFKGFTQLSEKLSPRALVAEINDCFSAFDHIMQKHGVEKIKTIGDAYMAAGGLPTPNKTHAEDVVKAAVEIQEYMRKHKAEKEKRGELFFEIRIGVHTGPVVAGIVGVKKFQYDIWGDTVNTASRMESGGSEGKVNISESTYAIVKDKFNCEYRGEIDVKGKGLLKMYFVG